jgi:hypothetical protein
MRRWIELAVLTLALLAVGVAAAVALTDPAGAETLPQYEESLGA